MREVWFIRHGESESNAGLPTTDTATAALTERGHAEALLVARSIPRAPDLIVSSPYLRAQQSAEPTVARFPDALREEWLVQEFTYLSLSLVSSTFHDRKPFSDAYWERCDPHHCDGDGTESFAGLMLRVATARERITNLAQPFTLVFSHGLFMKALIWSLIYNTLEIDADAMRRYRFFMRSMSVPNGAIVKIRQGEMGELWFSGIVADHLMALA